MVSVQTSKEYLKDLLSEIDNAKKYIFLQTMLFEDGENIKQIEEHLIKAAKRGVEVQINYDWVSERYIHGDLLKLPVIDRQRRDILNSIHEDNEKMHKRLEEVGVRLNVTNNPSIITSAFPYLGRSHIKTTIIDDKYCWVGGVNLYDDAFDNYDLMVKSDKKDLILALLTLFHQINENKSPDDYKVKIDSSETLFVDVGNKGKSIIYERVKEKISSAKNEIIFMSQYVPDSKILRDLEALSDKGVRIKIITSPEDDSAFTKYPEKLTYIILKKAIEDKKNIELIHLSKKVHAKLLLIDDEIGLYGSHNYIYSGVLFGTAEIMIETSDEKSLKGIREYLKYCLENK